MEYDANLHVSAHCVKYVVILPDPGAVRPLYIQNSKSHIQCITLRRVTATAASCSNAAEPNLRVAVCAQGIMTHFTSAQNKRHHQLSIADVFVNTYTDSCVPGRELMSFKGSLVAALEKPAAELCDWVL